MRTEFLVLAAIVFASVHGAAVAPLVTEGSSLAVAVRLTFTPSAARRLERTGEGVVVDAYWYGAPTAAHVQDGDQVGGTSRFVTRTALTRTDRERATRRSGAAR